MQIRPAINQTNLATPKRGFCAPAKAPALPYFVNLPAASSSATFTTQSTASRPPTAATFGLAVLMAANVSTVSTMLLMIAYEMGCGGSGGEPHRHAGAPPSPVHETEQARNASRRGGRSKGKRERCFVIDSERR